MDGGINIKCKIDHAKMTVVSSFDQTNQWHVIFCN